MGMPQLWHRLFFGFIVFLFKDYKLRIGKLSGVFFNELQLIKTTNDIKKIKYFIYFSLNGI